MRSPSASPSPYTVCESEQQPTRTLEDEPERGRTLKRKSYSNCPPVVKKQKKVHNMDQSRPTPEGSSSRERTDVFSSAPHLPPPDHQYRSPNPSSSPVRDRSTSPVRRMLNSLQQSRQICFRDVNAPEIPAPGYDLADMLFQDSGRHTIPFQMRGKLQHLREYRGIKGEAWSDVAEAQDTRDVEALWEEVDSIYHKARKAQTYQRDENAWVDVVRDVLKLAIARRTHPARDMDFEPMSIQTQSISPVYLPRQKRTAAQSHLDEAPLQKRTDLVIALDPEHKDVIKLQDACGSLPLSPMEAVSTKNIPLVMPVEVKASAGNLEEAKLQLAVWQYSALAHWRSLSAGARDPDAKPVLLGWTVIGHRWAFWTSQIGNDTTRGLTEEITSRYEADTSSYEEIFRLLAILDRMLVYITETHWPAFRRFAAQAGPLEGSNEA